MTDGTDRVERTDRSGRRTWDLAFVAVAVVVTSLALVAVDAPWPLEWVLGVPFLLFYPGYGVVSALFPEPTVRTYSRDSPQWASPDATVRVGLSLVTSAVVVALVGLGLGLFGAIRLVPVVASVGVVSLAGVAIAAIRRTAIEPSSRESAADETALEDEPAAWERFTPGSTLQTATMAVALLALLGAVAFTGAVPSEGDSYTEFYLLSEDDDGNLTAANYPETFVSGEGHDLYVGLENQEGESATYDGVVLAQAVSNGSVVIQQEVDRFDVQLEDGENATVERTVAPTIVGDEIRLQVLLYQGEVPENPRAETADESLHIWIDVVDDDS